MNSNAPVLPALFKSTGTTAFEGRTWGVSSGVAADEGSRGIKSAGVRRFEVAFDPKGGEFRTALRAGVFRGRPLRRVVSWGHPGDCVRTDSGEDSRFRLDVVFVCEALPTCRALCGPAGGSFAATAFGHGLFHTAGVNSNTGVPPQDRKSVV